MGKKQQERNLGHGWFHPPGPPGNTAPASQGPQPWTPLSNRDPRPGLSEATRKWGDLRPHLWKPQTRGLGPLLEEASQRADEPLAVFKGLFIHWWQKAVPQPGPWPPPCRFPSASICSLTRLPSAFPFRVLAPHVPSDQNARAQGDLSRSGCRRRVRGCDPAPQPEGCLGAQQVRWVLVPLLVIGSFVFLNFPLV